jgi:hypothetical protein
MVNPIGDPNPNVGMYEFGAVDEKKGFLEWQTRRDYARMERVHMRQNQPSLWPASFPVPSSHSPQTCPPSLSLVQSSSPSISSPYSMVRPSPAASRPVLTHLIRALPFPIWGVHQCPLQQATAKGRREPSPRPSLDIPFHPHNMGSYPSVDDHTFHSCPLQHLILGLIRVHVAYASEADEGATIYYERVTSMMSVMKTAVYLAGTIVSDLFIVRIFKSFFLMPIILICVALPVISMLYRMECKYRRHHFPSPSVYRRHWYVSPSSPTPPSLNASFSDRDRGGLYPVARRNECCIQPEARENHKLILLLHSRLERRLHRCVIAVADVRDASF